MADVIFAIAGIVLVIVGVLNRKIRLLEAKEFKLATEPLNRWERAVVTILGTVFIVIAVLPLLGIKVSPSVPTALPVATQTPAQLTVTPTNTTPTITQPPKPSETPASSPTPLSPDCKVGVLCDVIPKYAVGGKAFSWSVPADSVTSDLIQTCARSGALGLEMKYALSGENDNGGWGVHWVTAPDKHLDVSHLGYLTFWVKGTLGNETFQIGLKDTTGTEVKIQSDEFTSSISEWTLITIPLSQFKDVNTASVENVSFSVTRQHRAGNICIDDIGFQ